MGLESRQRQRRGDRPRPPDRGQRRARAHDATLRHAGSRSPRGTRHALSGRRRCRSPQCHPGLTTMKTYALVEDRRLTLLGVLAGMMLGPVTGAVSMLVYLAAGALGLPVFAPMGAPGMMRFFGPTGGYLLAYPVA